MSTILAPRPRSDGRSPSEAERTATAARSTRLADGVAPMSARLTQVPILILYPHSRCNCRCVMCDIWKPGHQDELDAAWVAREARAWRELGVRRVVLSGGEPLMHRDLHGLVEPLVSEGIDITLLTTGLLLQRHADWVASTCDEVIVSLDGPRDIHNAIRRVPRAFERLAEGVAAVKEKREAGGTGNGVRNARIAARCTVQRMNADSLEASVNAARELGLDGISFLAVDAHSDAFNRPGGPDEETVHALLPDRDQILAWREAIARLEITDAAAFGSGFIAESPSKLRRLADYFSACHGDGSFPPVRCNAPWVSAVVEADGAVRPCFFHRTLGRWDGSPLASVLNGEDALAFREDLDVARNATCQRCVCSLFLQPSAPGPMV